jgi:hypothetical protein
MQYNENGYPEIVITSKNISKQIYQDFQEIRSIIEKGKELIAEIKQYREKRSLDANSYAWVLISKIAEVLRTSKEEVYIEMLKRYGQSEKQLISVVAEAGDVILRATKNHCMEVGESTVNGKLFKHFRILIGSSQYDSKEMATLIDGIVSEAKELDIETMTQKELSLLKECWGRGKEEVG